jgi:hypothetical protein
MDMGRRATVGRYGLAKHAQRLSGLLAFCQNFREVCFSTLWPREAGGMARQNNEALFNPGGHGSHQYEQRQRRA